MEITLSQVANMLQQHAPAQDQPIQNIVIDSRIVKPGDLFVAIKGEAFDGHDFISQAISQGAMAIIGERNLENLSVPVFQVASTREALAKIAHAYRLRFNIPFVGVTGSCGKTSTKTLIASVLSQKGKTLATEGTFNNDIGLPLTLFRLTNADQFAVIELGANHAGEIDTLAKITEPLVAVITNSAPVHIEGFGSIEGVRKAKGEIYQNLMPEGVGIVNADDEGASYWMSLLQGKQVIRFSLAQEADVMAENIQLNADVQPSFILKIHGERVPVQLPVVGVHQVPNALAAAAVGYSQGLSLLQIKAGLESTPKVAKRGIFQIGYQGCLVIDDSYNANPVAFMAAIKMLMAVQKVTQHVVVMGDMGELGPDYWALHAGVGKAAKALGVSAFYSVGKNSAAASEAFGENGYHFADQASLIEALKKIANPEVCFLVKGSKSSHMGDVVARIK